MKKIFILVILALFSNLSQASFEEMQTDARIWGLAGAGVGLTDMTTSNVFNPAMPALADDLLISCGSSMPFGLKDLAAFSGSYWHRRDRMGAGLSLGTSGSSLYRENVLKGTFSYKLVTDVAVGVSLSCQQLDIEGYGSAVAPGIDLGLSGKPAEWLSLGVKAVNINRPGIGQSGEEAAQSISLGAAAKPLGEMMLSFELFNQRDWPCQVRIGQEYVYRNLLSIRAGFSSRPNAASFGFGIAHKSFRLDYAVRTHPDLGLSHCISIGYITRRAFAEKQELPLETGPVARIIDRINPNTASLEDICLLPGIGPKTAADIISFRDSIGVFEFLEDLSRVKGVGRSSLEKIAPYVTLVKKPLDQASPIDINKATSEELSALPGIGPKTAENIISYRTENGPFRSTEDIMNVKGIGRKTYEEIKQLISVGQ
jgi:competence protein ComEA